MKKWSLIITAVCMVFLFCAFPGAALAGKPFPHKNITWLVPSKAGGGYDIYARAIGRTMLKYLPKGIDMIYLNLPAGGGVESVTKLFTSKPDGYTIGFIKVPGTIVSQLTLDFAKFNSADISYIGTITTEPYCILVRKDSPMNTIADMKSKGTIKFSTTGIGATSWVNTVVFASEVGITPKYVHYTDTADAMLSVIRGDTESLSIPFFSAVPYVQSGDIKIITVFAKNRLEFAPEYPVSGEEGYPQFATLNLSRVLGYAPNTPEDVRAVMEEALWKTVNDQELVKMMKESDRPIIAPTKGAEALEMVKESIDVFTKYKPALMESIK